MSGRSRYTWRPAAVVCISASDAKTSRGIAPLAPGLSIRSDASTVRCHDGGDLWSLHRAVAGRPHLALVELRRDGEQSFEPLGVDSERPGSRVEHGRGAVARPLVDRILAVPAGRFVAAACSRTSSTRRSNSSAVSCSSAKRSSRPRSITSPTLPRSAAHLVDLVDDVVEELDVLVLVRREVERGDVARLAVAVDAAVALLQAHRVPGHLVVHDVAAGGLEVQTLGRDVGRDQQADWVRGLVERLPHLGALGQRGAAEERAHLRHVVALGRQAGASR